ncbi:MAG: universal stress protein [Chloroflexi bacterium]|nr:universal stress protein [Chloroflexota bacterium]
MEKISHIMVPINGNPEDEVALSLASLFAKKNKAKVTVVHVVEVKRSLPLDADLPAETAQGERLLDWAEGKARELECYVEVELLQARAAGPALVDEAVASHADLMLMGLPFRTQFGTYHLGETSNYVLNHAVCRVWLVREPYQPSGERRT